MNFIDKVYYNRWNIGFIEESAECILTSDDTEFEVKWVKHNFTDRFFADPFILSADDSKIEVLVEELLYKTKKGLISLLTIDRKTYELLEKKTMLDMPYHQSYPFILRQDEEVFVMPEASLSGGLYVYKYNPQAKALEERKCIINEPLLDSTIIKSGSKYLLFCTRRGNNSNKDLYIYESSQPFGHYMLISNRPVISTLSGARPAGYMRRVNGRLIRVAQVCDNRYGESINVYEIDKCDSAGYHQKFIKNVRPKASEFDYSFHTLNGFGNITVVDGAKREFKPLMRVKSELIYALKYR